MKVTRKVKTLSRSPLENKSSWEDHEQGQPSASLAQVPRNDTIYNLVTAWKIKSGAPGGLKTTEKSLGDGWQTGLD